MGGSGGGSYFDTDPETIKKRLRDSEKQTEDAMYESEIAHFLSSLLASFNDRDIEAINRHIDEIKKALDKEIDGTVDLLFGGSVAKHTYVDGLSDIDSLVILDNCELANGSPDAAKEYFETRLKEHFPNSEVTSGNLAVTIRFSDAEIQLLPAVSCKSHVKIADRTGNEWSEIRPRRFSEVLSRTNQQAGHKVVPVVKLAKAVIANLPEKHQISGYHAESLAVEIFQAYKGELKPKTMLKHYFAEAAKRVQQPIRDRTGQSVHVDDYLGAPNSLERRLVSDAFSRLYRRMNNGDNTGSTDEWHSLFGN